MKDFLNDENKTPEELENEKQAADEVVYEENDNWEFEAKAMTLEDTVLDNGELEIAIPRERPKASSAPTPKAPAPKTTSKKSGNTALFVVVSIITAIVLGVLVWLGIGYYTTPNTDEKMNPGNVAVTVGDTDVSVGMYNYYYTCIYNNYAQYAQYGYYDLDPTADFSTQSTTDSNGKKTTWDRVFVNDTIDQIKFITAYYEAAVADGVKLTKTQKEEIDKQLSSLKETASESDMSVDDYISQTYGEYCGYATLKKMLTQCYIAENYYQKQSVEQKVDSEKVEKYFNEHADDYSNVNFAYLQMGYTANDSASLAKATKDAEKYVKKIKSVSDMKKYIPEACASIIKEYIDAGYFENAEEAAETLSENIETTLSKSDTSFTEEGMNWLFSADTKVGDCSYFVDDENALVYVVLKTSEAKVDDDDVYSVRHILITPVSDENAEDEEASAEFTDEQWAAAEKKANQILDKFNKGDKTEYSFALLAEKYTDDVESTSNGSSGLYGGLYAGTEIGTMVPSFEDWAIDDSRKYGDVDIVKSKYGYHIMYFVEKTKCYLYNCENALISQDQEKFIKDYSVKKHKGAMKKTKVATPQQASAAESEDDSDDMDY